MRDCAGRLLAYQNARGDDPLQEFRISLRVDDVDPIADNRYRPLGERPFVGGGIDSARHSRYHDHAAGAQFSGHATRQQATRGGHVARADHGDGGFS